MAGILLISINPGTSGQTFSIKFDLHDLCRKNQIETFNRQISWFTENEREAIRLSDNEGDGIAWIRGVEFSSGVIEVDIRGTDELQEFSAGIAFHGSDNDTLDAIYFCPYDFPYADSDTEFYKVNYISLPFYTRSVLRENLNRSYEKSFNPLRDSNGWFHVRISVQTDKVSVFTDNIMDPILSFGKLSHRKTGKIGFWVGDNSGGDFANLKIITSARRNLKNREP